MIHVDPKSGRVICTHVEQVSNGTLYLRTRLPYFGESVWETLAAATSEVLRKLEAKEDATPNQPIAELF